MPFITIGKGPRADATIDVDVLLRTRLLIQANSGGGKSWLLRRIAEQLFGQVPIVIIDPEGEFATLREKLDFVLVGKGGETPADLRSAGLVARRLLELGASAVCDLYEMRNVEERQSWVAAFLDALIDAPKQLWRSLVVMIDEAHIFAPEKGAGESVATDAVLSLATRGRKRGYCGVLATQRLGKLRKDAAAELQNVLIGQTFIDLDRERAAEALGIPRGGRVHFFDQVKTMPPGQFFGFGRAISLEPVAIRVGSVRTTHPEPGSYKHAADPPPAPAAIRHLLPQLADLPRVAEAEARTLVQLQAEIAQLRKELAAAKKSAALPPRVTSELARAQRDLADVLARLKAIDRQGNADKPLPATAAPPAAPPATEKGTPANNVAGHTAVAGAIQLNRGERDILAALAAHHPTPLRRLRVANQCIMTPKGSTLRTYLGRLLTADFVRRGHDDDFAITDKGLAVVDGKSSPADAKTLVDRWRSKLTGKEKDMLELLAAEGRPMTKAEIAASMSLDQDGSTFRTYLGHLQTCGVVRKTTGGFAAAPDLVLGGTPDRS
jgi:hypothetical protein